MDFDQFLQFKEICDRENLEEIDEFLLKMKNEPYDKELSFYCKIRLEEIKGDINSIIQLCEDVLGNLDYPVNKTFISLHIQLILAKYYQQMHRITEMQNNLDQFSQHSEVVLLDERKSLFLTNFRLLIQAIHEISQHNLYNAEQIFTKLIPYFQKEEMWYQLGESFNMIGKIHYLQGQFEKAIEFIEKANTSYETLGNLKRVARLQNNLGLLYFQTAKFRPSIKILENAQIISEKCEDIENIANISNNLALVYSNMGKFHLAIEFFEKSLHYYQEIKAKDKVAYILSNLGEIFLRLDDYATSREYLFRSIDMFTQLNLEFLQIEPYHHLFQLSLAKNNIDEAFDYYNQMLSLRNQFPSRVNEMYLKLINLQMVAHFQGIAKLFDSLTLVKELVVSPKIRIEIRLQALIIMCKLLNETMLNEKCIEYLEVLKDMLKIMENIAKQSFSYYILGICYIVEGNIALIEHNQIQIEKSYTKLENLNTLIPMSVLTETMLLLKTHQPHPGQGSNGSKSVSEDVQRYLKKIKHNLKLID